MSWLRSHPMLAYHAFMFTIARDGILARADRDGDGIGPLNMPRLDAASVKAGLLG